MRNILIPSTLENDTIQAVKTALAQAGEKSQTIILMLLQDSPDTVSAAYWLRHTNSNLTAAEENILETCREMVSFHEGCKLKIHRQFSITAPLLRNFTEASNIGLVVLTDTFSNSGRFIHRNFLKLVKSSKTPILHLAPQCEELPFSKALFIENAHSQLQAKDLPKMIGGHFSFRIISQTTVSDDQNHEELTPLLFETINRNGIDLLIETRKPKKIRSLKNDRFTVKDNFGLPVLSICEPTY